jgi:hypothetical protein
MEKKTLTPAERLAKRVAALDTPRLVEVHGETLKQYYAGALPEAEPLSIVINALVAEMEDRGVEFNLCCYCPKPHHDEQICDRDGRPSPLTEAADLIMEGIARVRV